MRQIAGQRDLADEVIARLDLDATGVQRRDATEGDGRGGFRICGNACFVGDGFGVTVFAGQCLVDNSGPNECNRPIV